MQNNHKHSSKKKVPSAKNGFGAESYLKSSNDVSFIITKLFATEKNAQFNMIKISIILTN